MGEKTKTEQGGRNVSVTHTGTVNVGPQTRVVQFF